MHFEEKIDKYQVQPLSGRPKIGILSWPEFFSHNQHRSGRSALRGTAYSPHEDLGDHLGGQNGPRIAFLTIFEKKNF